MESRARRKIPVVYYLSRNRHLEHPHFIEVPLSSPEGLYLRDVINRLNAIRGKGMPALYSWSCKRSYKNGFVWHDLLEDDLILPANGNEYVLKGSELLDQSSSDRIHQTSQNPKLLNQKKTHEETLADSSRHKEVSSSSSPQNPNFKQIKSLHSPSSSRENESSPSSLSSGPHSPIQSERRTPARPVCAASADASTQTEDQTVRKPNASTQTEDQNVRRSETLESLIRSEPNRMGGFRVLEEEEPIFPLGPKLSPASYLMQLITCGSISVKNHRRLGFIPSYNYKPSYTQVELPSPFYSSSVGFLSRLEDKEYFSGSIVESKKFREEVGERVPVLKRSSSYNAERTEEQFVDSARSRCLPRTIKLTSSIIQKSPLSDCPRNSFNGRSRRFMNDDSPVNDGSSVRAESFRKEKEEKLIKIEERLTSGARVIIQSRVLCDDSEEGLET